MNRLRQRVRKHNDAAELDVTPFMNLMIVLVPVLLLSMVFTHTTVIELNFPTGEGGGPVDPDSVHLEVIVRAAGLEVADGRGGSIRHLPRLEAGHDFARLTEVMRELKRRMPEKDDIAVLLEDETDYQTLVAVMDRVRSYPAVLGLEVVDAELFPVIALGDSPPEAAVAAAAGSTDRRAGS
jgi:biopolymer transport protein ExbD